MPTRLALVEDYVFQTLTDAATVVFDVKQGQVARLVLVGNRTLSVTNLVQGRTYQLFVEQGGAGSFSLSLPTNMKFTGNGVPAWTPTVGRVDIICFTVVGGTLYSDFKTDFLPV